MTSAELGAVPAAAPTKKGLRRVYPGSSIPDAAAGSAPDDLITASTANAATFLTGTWLIASPFALGHTATGGEFGGHWNDVTIGGVVALLAMLRAVVQRDVPSFRFVNLALGCW